MTWRRLLATAVTAVGEETGVTVVERSTRTLPDDGSYRSSMLDIANTIADGLR